MKKLNLLVMFCLLLSAIPVSSDTIILKSGKALKGTVESQSNNVIYFKDQTGKVTEIKKDDIRNMLYVEPQPVTIKKKKIIPKKKVMVIPKPDNDSEDEETDERNKPISKKQTNENLVAGERVTERTEKVTVDKELTNSVMQKFEEADKRRQKMTESELELLREELKYLKESREKAQSLTKEREEFQKNYEPRITNLEIRIRRLEKYLGMDETMVEYYQTPRSPWQIVWRSAVFPGWGHRYAKEEYTGNAYSTTFLVLLGVGYLFKYQTAIAEETLSDKFRGDLIVRHLQLSSLSVDSNLTTSQYFTIYNTYNTGVNGLASQKAFANGLISAAGALYCLQLVHAYFTGVEWAKTKPRDYSNQELMKPTGWNFKMIPDYAVQMPGSPVGTGYSLEFTTKF